MQAQAAWHKACWQEKVRWPVHADVLPPAVTAGHAAAEQLRPEMASGQEEAHAAPQQGRKRRRAEAAAAAQVPAAAAGAGEERGLGMRAAKRPRRFQQ